MCYRNTLITANYYITYGEIVSLPVRGTVGLGEQFNWRCKVISPPGSRWI